MADKQPKTNLDLDLRARNLQKLIDGFENLGGSRDTNKAFSRFAELLDPKQLDEFIAKTKKIVKSEQERLDIYKALKEEVNKTSDIKEALSKRLNKEINDEYKLLETIKQRKAIESQLLTIKKAGKKLLDAAVASNKEIFEISHKMQLESNVTWANYRKIYDNAYETTKMMNQEINKSVYNVKDLIKSQEKMLGAGWRDMDPTTLTKVSASVMNLSKTLGTLDVNLITAFQQSYRILGEQTDAFITAMGNRLNAFSDTFGASIGMLQGTVSEMIDANNFISRNNMEAQISANENLIRAAALSARMGLTTTSFLTQLAKTSQWGTMEEMAGLYEGGALLQNFDTAGFQQQMVDQDYAGATKQLFSSISDTLNNIDDHYLRAEYMQRIGSTFGLSDDELLRISTHGGNLEAYDQETIGKLAEGNNSMVEELGDLKVALMDRLENWYENSPFTQKVGEIMQEAGLYGIGKPIYGIATGVATIVKQNAVTQGLLAKTGGTSVIGSLGLGAGASGASGLSGGAKVAGGLGGLALAGIGTSYFADRSADLDKSLGGNAVGNFASGIAGGAITGAMIGGPAGAGIGAALGAVGAGIQHMKAVDERESAMEQLEADKRDRAKAEAQATYTGDPIVDAINRQTSILKSTLDANYEENRRTILISDTINKTRASID